MISFNGSQSCAVFESLHSILNHFTLFIVLEKLSLSKMIFLLGQHFRIKLKFLSNSGQLIEEQILCNFIITTGNVTIIDLCYQNWMQIPIYLHQITYYPGDSIPAHHMEN